MSQNNYWIKNGIINVLQNSISTIVSFLSFYFLVRILEHQEDYGAWILFLSVISIMEWSRNGFTQEALIKYLSSANRGESRKITTAALSINITLTVVVMGVTLLIAPYLAKIWNFPEILTLLAIYMIGYIFTGVSGVLNNVEQANLSFKGVFYSNLARQLVFFLYLAFCFFSKTSTNLKLLTYAQLASVLVAFPIALMRSRRYLRLTKTIDMMWVRKIFHFGKYTFGVSLSSMLASTIDQMMLGSMMSKASSGIFNISVRVYNLASIPTIALASIVYPQSSRRSDKEGPSAVKYLYERSVGVNLAILMPFAVIGFAFAHIIVPLIASAKYIEAVPLLRIALLGSIITPYALQAGTILTSAGHTKFNFYMVLLSVSTLIILNYFFIKYFGIMGAAVASILSSILGLLVCMFYLKKHFGINFLNPWIYAYKFYPEFFYRYIKKK